MSEVEKQPEDKDEKAAHRLRAEVKRLKARLQLYEQDASRSLTISRGGMSKRFSIPGVREMTLETDARLRKIRHVNTAFAVYFKLDKERTAGKRLVDIDRVPYAPGLFTTLLMEARLNPGHVVEFQHESTDALTGGPRNLLLRAQVGRTGASLVVIDETRMRLVEDYFARYVSPHLLEQLVASPTDFFRCRTLEATVLHLDIHRFERTTELAPERVTDALRPYHGTAIDEVHAAGGTVIHLVADQVIAVFGAPVSTQDHPVRGCLAARSILDRKDDLTAAWQALSLGALRIRIGVASGACVAGNLGDERRAVYGVLGPPVSMAQRLMQRAPPNHVLVAPSTVDAVQAYAARKDNASIPRLSLARVKPMEDALGSLEAYVLRQSRG